MLKEELMAACNDSTIDDMQEREREKKRQKRKIYKM